MAGVTLSLLCVMAPMMMHLDRFFFLLERRPFSCLTAQCILMASQLRMRRRVCVCMRVCVFARRGLWTYGQSPVEISTCSFEPLIPSLSPLILLSNRANPLLFPFPSVFIPALSDKLCSITAPLQFFLTRIVYTSQNAKL